jgi:catechol 2,3-dioxygenase-like lactoylglutathione lyase family enzyme
MNLRPAIIELVVADMARSLAFYRLLGFDIPAEADGEDHVDTVFGEGVRIAWDTEQLLQSMESGWTAPVGSHRCALAFECEDPAAVDAAYAEITAAGYEGHLEPWDAFWGMRYAVVHDPDGTAIDLFATLPAK